MTWRSYLRGTLAVARGGDVRLVALDLAYGVRWWLRGWNVGAKTFVLTSTIDPDWTPPSAGIEPARKSR